MRLEAAIRSKLEEAFAPHHLVVTNESGMHAVAPGSETHFRVLVVSDAFEGKPLLARHRMIYEVLQTERDAGVHALGIQTQTPEEYDAEQRPPAESPPCTGGEGTGNGA